MRGKRAKQRKVRPDERYDSPLVNSFINKIMQGGKKQLAEKMFYGALEESAKKVKQEPLEFLKAVVLNVSPALEVKARRVGGSNYHVPVPVTPERQETLVIRWIVDAARKQTGASFQDLIAKELLEAYNGVGVAMKKKEDVERMAEANKAFAHFKW